MSTPTPHTVTDPLKKNIYGPQFRCDFYQNTHMKKHMHLPVLCIQISYYSQIFVIFFFYLLLHNVAIHHLDYTKKTQKLIQIESQPNIEGRKMNNK